MTTPLCAWYFGTVSLVGILTNLLTLWIVTYIFCGIVAACFAGLFWLSAGRVIANVISWGIRYVILVAKCLSGIPVAAVYTASIYIIFWLIFAYILIIAFLCMKNKHPLVFACCIVIGLCVSLLASWIEPLTDECRVTVMDVGQGQCVLQMLHSLRLWVLTRCISVPSAWWRERWSIAILASQWVAATRWMSTLFAP
jgi:competence protein ComEC